MRTEAEILADLEAVCTSSGYIHALAYLCWRDNFISYSRRKLTPDDLLNLRSATGLIRTEISTLIGFMVKRPINVDMPSPDVIQKFIDDTEKLLQEFHSALSGPFKIDIGSDGNPMIPSINIFESAEAMREPIFYAAESAYSFQYRDFSPLKYQDDKNWLENQKGFQLDNAVKIIKAIADIQNNKLTWLYSHLKIEEINSFSLLPAFTFKIEEIVELSGCSEEEVRKFITSFLLPSAPCNSDFKKLGDFNLTNASPIIDLGDDVFLLFQYYSIVEAFYEAPFYWMLKDDSYKNIATKNRGNFTEKFCADRLKSVFGRDKVYENIVFTDPAGKRAGEIDVLVIYANRAIILQAKSKRLTLEARKGNDNALKEDFKKGIQDSYDQGFKCANLLSDKDYIAVDSSGVSINIKRDFEEIYIFCTISDHYPALAFQAEQFLEYKQDQKIFPPYVMDIFFLDVLCELLDKPLYFLSFVRRRLGYSDKFMATNELAILSYHVRRNLWFEDEYTGINLGDDISVDIDAAMLVRREGMPGERTPNGILTKYKNHTFGKLIEHLSNADQDGMLDIGLFLLDWSENAARSLGDGIKKITRQTKQDGKLHDISMLFKGVGITIHCSSLPLPEMMLRLRGHCTIRKYKQKSDKWFGIAKSAEADDSYKVALVLSHPWEYSENIEHASREFVGGKMHPDLTTALRTKNKIGRNEQCPCGSGKKYKKCHGQVNQAIGQ